MKPSLPPHPLHRPIPRDLSRRRLFLPDETYPYLAGSAGHPFRPAAGGFEAVNAWWLAEISMLAYVRSGEFIRRTLERAGFPDAALIESPPGSRWNTRCIWAEQETFVIVCFRGTEPGSTRDYATDARFQSAPMGGRERVHRGFRDALEGDGVADRLSERLGAAEAAGKAVWFSGHSLGAALATLAARRHGGGKGLYTLGSPRVGNEAFWAEIRTPAFRIVNHSDLVTMVPAAFPGRYAHGGTLVYLDRWGALREAAPSAAVLADRWSWPGRHYGDVLGRWWKGELDQIPLRSISDHSPLHYAIHLWNNYVTAGVEA